MIIFNGKYVWDGKKAGAHKPVSWWPGSHYLTVFDFSVEKPGVIMLKPYVVLAADPKEGYSVNKRYQDLIMGVCREFKLNMDKLLWVRYSRDLQNEMKVAVLKVISKMGPHVIYDVQWRPLMANEKKLIDSLMPSVEV